MADFSQNLTVSSAGKEIKVTINSLPTNCNISAATDSSWITVNKSTSTGSAVESVFTVSVNTGATARTGHVYLSATTVDDLNYDSNVTKTFDGTISQEKARGDAQVGMIAYYSGGTIKYIHYLDWKSSLGTPIGVCVIPACHATVWGDGKARYISVTGVNLDGSQSSTNVEMKWGPTGDTSLTNYTKVPTWDNTIGGTVGSYSYGYISSDDSGFTGVTNVIDTVSKYNGSTPYIPSPYSGNGEFYADYMRTIEDGNMLSDFNGKANTATLVGLGTAYSAANACYKYKTSGTSAGDWYLPAEGELAYIVPRMKEIDTALGKCGGVTLDYNTFLSSTEYGADHSCKVGVLTGVVNYNSKDRSLNKVRPFVALS